MTKKQPRIQSKRGAKSPDRTPTSAKALLSVDRRTQLTVLLLGPFRGPVKVVLDELRRRLTAEGHTTILPEEALTLPVSSTTTSPLHAEQALFDSADLVFIFVTSLGSLVELGYFSALPGGAQKLMVFFPDNARSSLSAAAIQNSGSVVRFYSPGDIPTGALINDAMLVAHRWARLKEYRTSEHAARDGKSELDPLPPRDFEQLCLEILRNAGYSVIQGLTGPDSGIDILAYGRLPFAPTTAKVIAECKVQDAALTAEQARRFVDKVSQVGAEYGILFVSSETSKAALDVLRGHPVTVLDRNEIKRLSSGQLLRADIRQ